MILIDDITIIIFEFIIQTFRISNNPYAKLFHFQTFYILNCQPGLEESSTGVDFTNIYEQLL